MTLMYFPQGQFNPPAKLFQSFVFSNDTDKQTQLANFKNYKSFRWVISRNILKGRNNITPTVVANYTLIRIETNYDDEIAQGDIVWLPPCVLYPRGKYFTVAEPAEIRTVMCPKMEIFRQFITLQNLEFDQINIDRN